MGFPAPRISLSLIVFVFTADDRLETVGGRIVEFHHFPSLTRGREPSNEVPNSTDANEPIRRMLLDSLPSGTLPSRIYPLMPRVRDDASVFLPYWAAGRLNASTARGRAEAHGDSLQLDALERLARLVRDDSLVHEARSEFRRAVAMDPVSMRLISDTARAGIVATAESERRRDRDCDRGGDSEQSEYPPLFALLPEQFTIDELHRAILRAAQLSGEEFESSNNFRRRLKELLDTEVLVDLGQAGDEGSKGRAPRLYRFDKRNWRVWIERNSFDTTLQSFPTRGSEAHPYRTDFLDEESIERLARLASVDRVRALRVRRFDARNVQDLEIDSGASPQSDTTGIRLRALEEQMSLMKNALTQRPASVPGKLR